MSVSCKKIKELLRGTPDMVWFPGGQWRKTTMNNIFYLYNTHIAAGFEAIYELGQLGGEVAFHREILWFANLFVLTGLFIGQCQIGQFMIQNCKVVHWPDKQPETAELKWLIRDESIQSSALSYPNRILLLLLTISCPV